MKENIIEVVADSGCQSFFFPLFTQDSVETPLRDTVWSLPENFEEWNSTIQGETRTSILASLSSGNIAWNVIPEIPYIRYQFARRKYNPTASIVGIVIAVETNQDHDGTGGFFLNEELVPRDDERQTMVDENGILRQPPSPYNAVAINRWVLNKIPQEAANPTRGIVPSEDGGIKIPLDPSRTLEFEFFVGFKGSDTEQPCDVDLIIDFGNSRTMALLLKEGRLGDRPNGPNDSIGRIRQNCVPVLLKLSDRKAIFKKDLHDVNNGVVSSSFVLHETQFSQSLKLLQKKLKAERLPCGFLGLGRKTVVTSEVQRVSNMFVQVSPVLLGDEADDCLHDAAVINSLTKHGAMVQQSSPKRYFWDKRRPTHNWDMIPNYIPGMALTLPPLEADILQWMDENGEFVDLENPEQRASNNPLQPTNPNYPRSATFIWMFVGILERAWKQCNSFSFGTNRYEQFVLKNIIVTYPAGWSGDELDRYRSLCRASVDIFRKNHFGQNVDINLDMELDEAVASQLPFVFSEIHEFGDNAEGWLNFAGKQRKGRNTVRILNFDIGGGTSDISLVEYEDLDDATDYTRLQPRLLYKNGFSTAGDEVLRQIIGTIVLKGIAEKNTNPNKTPSQLLEALSEYFRISGDEDNDIIRARIVKQCLVPIAIAIMNDLGRPNPNLIIKLEDIGITADQWDNEFCDKFLRNLDGMPPLNSLEISYDKTEVDQIIRGAFENGFKFLAELTNNYDVDLFFSSGKTSELPVIQELAMQYIPLTPERIVTAKNYRAGDWYPFANPAENTIKDAKSVTAVGAALFHILSGQNRHLVDNWQILPTVIDIDSNFEWGLLNRTDFSLSKVFEFNDDATASVNLRPDRIIAKRLSQKSKPDAVYRFSPKDKRSTMNECTVQLKRLIDEEKHTERLRLISVIDPDGRDVTNDFELTLFQYADEKALWQDTGRIL